jgi:hypothetical protein
VEEQHIGEQRREAAAPQQETSPSPPVVGERHIPKPRREVMAPRRETLSAAEGRRVPKPATEAQPRAAAPKKATPEDRAAKQRPTNEALNAVRRFLLCAALERGRINTSHRLVDASWMNAR